MPRYGYYPKGKWNGEVIKSTFANNPAQAVSYFAKIKNLDKKEFVKIYEVIEK